MPTECSAELFEFARLEGRSVVAVFDGGKITSDAGALLLGASNRADRFDTSNTRALQSERSRQSAAAAMVDRGVAIESRGLSATALSAQAGVAWPVSHITRCIL